MALTMAQIARYAYDAGVTKHADLTAAVAIAMAESGGDPTEYNGKDRDRSYGLWQINMKPSEVGDRKSELGISSNDALFDPATNAAAMYKISGGGKNWKPWTTWPVKAAPFMLFAASAASGTITKGAVTGAPEKLTDGLVEATGVDTVAGAAGATKAWVSNRNNWVRVAKVIIGGTFLVGGAVLLARPVLAESAKATKSVTWLGKG